MRGKCLAIGPAPSPALARLRLRSGTLSHQGRGKVRLAHTRHFLSMRIADNWISQRSAAPVLGDAGAPSSPSPARPEKNRGRAGRQGSWAHSGSRKPRKRKCPDPRAPAPRDTEACRSPSRRKSAKTQGVPRAVFIGLLREGPRWSPFVKPIAKDRMTLHRRGPGAQPAVFLTRPPAYRPSGASARG